MNASREEKRTNVTLRNFQLVVVNFLKWVFYTSLKQKKEGFKEFLKRSRPKQKKQRKTLQNQPDTNLKQRVEQRKKFSKRGSSKQKEKNKKWSRYIRPLETRVYSSGDSMTTGATALLENRKKRKQVSLKTHPSEMNLSSFVITTYVITTYSSEKPGKDIKKHQKLSQKQRPAKDSEKFDQLDSALESYALSKQSSPASKTQKSIKV